MTDLTPSDTKNLDTLYGSGALDWARAETAMATETGPEITYFIGTCRPDGTPHAAGIGALWNQGHLYFTSSPATRKSRDLTDNQKCTISVRLPGIDLTLDGEARRETDAATLERIAAGYRESGWPAQVADGAFTAPFSAPSAGPAPWHVYRFTFDKAVGVATAEPFGATRWLFKR
jgi:hypothetical protein